MKLSIRAMALTAGLIWGGALLLVGIVNLMSPAYGRAFLELCASVYPGYRAEPTFTSVIVGTLYGVVDGGIAGAVFAWLYNLFAGKSA